MLPIFFGVVSGVMNIALMLSLDYDYKLKSDNDVITLIYIYISANALAGSLMSFLLPSVLSRSNTAENINMWLKFAKFQWWADCLIGILLITDFFHLGIQRNTLTINFIFPGKIFINTVNLVIAESEIEEREETDEETTNLLNSGRDVQYV